MHRLNFVKVTQESQEFLDLAKDELVEMVKSDELNVKNEAALLEIITKWIDFDPESRKSVIQVFVFILFKYII
jgi:kelch-like protein 10